MISLVIATSTRGADSQAAIHATRSSTRRHRDTDTTGAAHVPQVLRAALLSVPRLRPGTHARPDEDSPPPAPCTSPCTLLLSLPARCALTWRARRGWPRS